MMWCHWLLNHRPNDKFLTATEQRIEQVTEDTEVFHLSCQVVSVKKLCKRTFAVRVSDGSFCKMPVAHFNEDKEHEVVHMGRTNIALDIYTTVRCSSDDFKFKAGIFIKIPNIQVKKFENGRGEEFLLFKINLLHSKICVLEDDDPKREEISRRLELLKAKCQSSLRLDTDTEMTDGTCGTQEEEDRKSTGEGADKVDSVNPHANISGAQLGDLDSTNEDADEGDLVSSWVHISGAQHKSVGTKSKVSIGDVDSTTSRNQISDAQHKDLEAISEGVEEVDSADPRLHVSGTQPEDLNSTSEDVGEIDPASSRNQISGAQHKDIEAMSEVFEKVNSPNPIFHVSGTQHEDLNSTSEDIDEIGSASSHSPLSGAQHKDLEAMSECVEEVDSIDPRVHVSGRQCEDLNSTCGDVDEIDSASSRSPMSGAQLKDLEATSEGVVDKVVSCPRVQNSGTQPEDLNSTSEDVCEIDSASSHSPLSGAQHKDLEAMSEGVEEADSADSRLHVSGTQPEDLDSTSEDIDEIDSASSRSPMSGAQRKNLEATSEGGVDEVGSVNPGVQNSGTQREDLNSTSEDIDEIDSACSHGPMSDAHLKDLEATSEGGVDKVGYVNPGVQNSGTQCEDLNSTSEDIDEIDSASSHGPMSDAQHKDLEATGEGGVNQVHSVGSLDRIFSAQQEDPDVSGEGGVDEVDFINPLIPSRPEQHLSIPCSDMAAMGHSIFASADSTSLESGYLAEETRDRVAGEPLSKRSRLDNSLLQRKDDLNHRPAVPGKTPILRCGCVEPGTGLFAVRGRLTDVDPPLSSSPLDLVCGVCPNCLSRTRYTRIEFLRPLERKQLCRMCFLQTGSKVYLNLELFAKFTIRDERNERKTYEAILGRKIKMKLRYCPAEEYISNPLTRMITWNRLKKLASCKNVGFMFYLANTNGGGFVLQDIKVLEAKGT